MLLYTIVAILAVVFTQVPPRQAAQGSGSQEHLNKSEVAEPAKAEPPKAEPIVDQPATEEPAPQPQVKAEVVHTTPTPVPAGSCEDAIAKVWPAELQSGARLVALKESSLIADRIGSMNSDGSQDFGCFQINNRYHPQFFANGDWRDPTYNAQYALRLYQERGNWTAWYAVRGILW